MLNCSAKPCLGPTEHDLSIHVLPFWALYRITNCTIKTVLEIMLKVCCYSIALIPSAAAGMTRQKKNSRRRSHTATGPAPLTLVKCAEDMTIESTFTRWMMH